jgi:hypothetical protein
MCPVDKLSSSEREVYDRITRDIAAGRQLKILTAEEESILTQQVRWAVDHNSEWQALKAFHHARNAISKFFESSETTVRLPYLRASYLKMLAHTNPQPDINWNYTVASAWKEALLDNYGNFLAGTRQQDWVRRFSRTFLYIPRSGRSQEKEKHGDVGGVRLFVWQGLTWAFKPAEQNCKLAKANASGIPKTNACMHNRSLASYLLAKALGLERIIVKTEFAYYQSDRLEPGILMEGASGSEPQKMLPDIAKLTRWSQAMNKQQLSENFEGCITAHKRRDLSLASFKNVSFASDLFAANWLDFIAAQMDRHLNNIYINYSRTDGYRGIKLIDNDMAFGTETAPEKLKMIVGSQNCGVPSAIPAGLEPAIRSIVQNIINPDIFWTQCQQGEPVLPKVQEARRNLPSASSGPQQKMKLYDQMNIHTGKGSQPLPAVSLQPAALGCMAGIARLLAKNEFVSLMKRMKTAATAAMLALPVQSGAMEMMLKQYQDASNEKKQELIRTSYWHGMVNVYDPQSGIPDEYDNPPKSAEAWFKSVQQRN